jgi:hypothetical protein
MVAVLHIHIAPTLSHQQAITQATALWIAPLEIEFQMISNDMSFGGDACVTGWQR